MVDHGTVSSFDETIPQSLKPVAPGLNTLHQLPKVVGCIAFMEYQ